MQRVLRISIHDVSTHDRKFVLSIYLIVNESILHSSNLNRLVVDLPRKLNQQIKTGQSINLISVLNLKKPQSKI